MRIVSAMSRRLERLPAASVRPETAAWVRQLADNEGAKPSGVVARLLEKLHRFPELYAQVLAHPYKVILHTGAQLSKNTRAYLGDQNLSSGPTNPDYCAPVHTGVRPRTCAHVHTSVQKSRHPTSSSSSTSSTSEEEDVHARVHTELWPTLAQSLLDSYPHGWGDDRMKRIPSPLDVEAHLRPLIAAQVDPAEVLAGAHRLAEAKQGADGRYTPNLLSWLKSKGWTARLEKAPDDAGDYDREAKNRRDRERSRREAEERARGPSQAPVSKPRTYRERPQ